VPKSSPTNEKGIEPSLRLDFGRTLRFNAAVVVSPVHAAVDMTYTNVSARRAKNLRKIAPAGTRGSCWTGIGVILGQPTRDAQKIKQQCDEAAEKQANRRACYRGASVG
jgi:hypothetical protein